MPVRYSEHSAGPSTRRATQQTVAVDYGALSKVELQALLKHMGLPTSGNKDELIERLEAGTED